MSNSLRYLIPSWAILLAACGGDLLAPRGSISSSTLAARAVTPDLSSWPVSASRIDLSWTDNQRNEAGWEVHRSTTGATGQFTLLASLGLNSTSFSNTGLNERTEYCYKVRSFKKNGPNTTYGAFTSVSCTTTPGRPAAPSNLSAGLYEVTVRVAWTDNANDEQAIRVERSTDAAGPWQTVTTLGANVQELLDYNRPVEQLWCYRVIATNTNGESSPSNVDCTAIPQFPPSITAEANGAAIDVRWTDASNVEEGYELSRALDDLVFAVIATLPANSGSYTDAGAAPDTRHWYRVRALREGGGSHYVGNASASYAVAPPRAPESVTAYPAGSTGAGVNSVSTSVSAFEFRFERSTDGGASWVTAGTNTSPDFWDGDRETEREVCYRVYAKNSFGESPASSMDCTRPLTAPSNLEVTYPNDGSVLVTWKDNSNFEEQYQIWTEVCYYDPWEDAWYCFLWNTFQVAANSTSFSFFPQLEYGEYVSAVYAYADGGYSDPGYAGDPSGIAASVSSTKLSAKGFVRPVKGARSPAPPLSARTNGVRKGSPPKKD